MSKTKKRILNFFLGFIGFALLVGILFLAIAPGIPTEQLNSSGVSSRYLSLPNGRYLGDDVAGILSGEGVFEFDTGEVYTGSWQFNNMNGEGKLEKASLSFLFFSRSVVVKVSFSVQWCLDKSQRQSFG